MTILTTTLPSREVNATKTPESIEYASLWEQAEALRRASSEVTILAGALTPASDKPPLPVGEVHERFVDTYALTPASWHVTAFLDILQRTPGDNYRIDGPQDNHSSEHLKVKRTPSGDRATALGAELLRLTLPFPSVPIRALNPGAIDRGLPVLAFPARNRLLIYRHLLEHPSATTGLSIVRSDTEQALSLDVARKTLNHLGTIGLIQLLPERIGRNKSKQWSVTLLGQDLLTRFIEISEGSTRSSSGASRGLKAMREILSVDQQELATLFRKGVRANGHLDQKGNAASLAKTIIRATTEYQGSILTINQLRALLPGSIAYNLTTTKLYRMIGKLGNDAPLTFQGYQAAEVDKRRESLWKIA